MPASILYLTPREWRAAPPDLARIRDALAGAQVIDSPLETLGPGHYRPGERLLQTITFLGCSPVVALGEPGVTGDSFVHIELQQLPSPTLVTSELTRAPRCPRCRRRIETWMELVTAWRQAPEAHRATCACGHEVNAADLEWRQVGGAGCLFLKVWGVFEGEAVPGDELLDLLARTGGGRWHHFYFRGEPG